MLSANFFDIWQIYNVSLVFKKLQFKSRINSIYFCSVYEFSMFENVHTWGYNADSNLNAIVESISLFLQASPLKSNNCGGKRRSTAILIDSTFRNELASERRNKNGEMKYHHRNWQRNWKKRKSPRKPPPSRISR